MGDVRPNWWSIANTILLIFMSIIGSFVLRWMDGIEGKLQDVIQGTNALSTEVQALKSERDYEKGRMAGIKEALAARKKGEE